MDQVNSNVEWSPPPPQPTRELIRCMVRGILPTNITMSLQSEDALTLAEILHLGSEQHFDTLYCEGSR